MGFKITMDMGNIEKKLDKLIKNAEDFAKYEINIGVISKDSELQMIAKVHEFGAEIPVTDKMRGWFAANGYPLKKSTTVINIPERSFLRSGKKKHQAGMISKVRSQATHVMQGNVDIDVFMKAIGDEFAGKIQSNLIELKSPPNSGMTVEKKGSSNPLVDTGRLAGAIDSEVKRK